MGKLRDYIDKLRSYTPELIEREIFEIVKDQEHVAVDLITSQLMHGHDGEGKSLGEYKYPWYAEFKKTLNPRGVVDLKLEGDFHASIFIESNGFPVMFNASDEKADKLIDKYGEDILKLSKDNLTVFARGYLDDPIKALYRKILRVRELAA